MKIKQNSLCIMGLIALGYLNPSCLMANNKKNNKSSEDTVFKIEEFGIPFTEDLMREHGILNRLLLIYDEIIKRIDTKQEFPISTLSRSADIIKSFIEDYHEKLEEDYVFPLFEAQKKEVKLVKTLRDQHKKGRVITTQLQELATAGTPNAATKKTIKNLLKKFITMYRPHEARENTVLFPLVRSLISEEKFKELSAFFDKTEEERFGEHGFEKTLNQVVVIEKELGIYALEKFTPKTD
ncbi:MAG: hemerythrin domain-containing protein [Candidatus Dependentiae bacterium]|nr:hemerythrin domain-containing protein [Candidatus Dependentiae bacterium]